MWGSNALKWITVLKGEQKSESETMGRNSCELRAKKPCSGRVFCKALCSSCDIPRLPVDEWQTCGSKACFAKVVVSQWAATAPHVSLRVYKMKTPMLRDPRHSHKYNDLATRSKELGPSTTSTNMVNLYRPSFSPFFPAFKKACSRKPVAHAWCRWSLTNSSKPDGIQSSMAIFSLLPDILGKLVINKGAGKWWKWRPWVWRNTC